MEGVQTTYDLADRQMNGFGDSGVWLFAILALMSGGFGGFGKGGVATADDLNFGRLENQVRANAQLTETKTDAINNGICKLGYEMAEKFGQTNALIIAENQKTRDMIQQDKIEALKSRISQLELNQALTGMVKYPTTATYAVPPAIPFNTGGCNGNI